MKKKKDENENEPTIGSFGAITNIMHSTLSGLKRGKGKKREKMKREDFIAIILTVIIILILGVILWFIPFTRSFIRNLIPF